MALRFFLCASMVMIWAATQSGAWSRCGPLKTCRCFPATGMISCRDAGLRCMPLLKVKGYRTLDLRGNKIETLGTFDSKRFDSIDLRGNPLSCINVPDNVRHDPVSRDSPPRPPLQLANNLPHRSRLLQTRTAQ